MKQTPWISFNNATQVQTKSAADLKPGAELALIQNFFVAESDTAPTFPWPAEALTLTQVTFHESNSAEHAPAHIDWVLFGGYNLLFQSSRVIQWSAPERPDMWDLTETVGGVTVKTGAGSETVDGTGEFKFAIVIGQSCVVFDEEGIGLLSLSGDWTSPFAYSKNIGNLAAYSWPVQFGNTIYFIDKGGKLFSLAWGSYAQEVQGPFNLHLALGSSWSENYPNLLMQFIEAEHRLVAYIPGSGLFINAMIDFRSGGFSMYNTSAYSMIKTGGIPLVDPGDRCHVQRVDLKVKLSSAPTVGYAVQIATADVYEQAFTTGETVAVPNTVGEHLLQFVVDQTVSHAPMFEFLPVPTATTSAWAVGTTYAIGAYVTYQGNIYISLKATNVGNYPPTFRPWQWYTTYALNDTVLLGSTTYKSLQAGNLAHPITVTDAWNTLTNYSVGQAVTEGGNKYISLLASNVGNDPTGGAPWWAAYDPADWWVSYDSSTWWASVCDSLKMSFEGMRIMYDVAGERAGKD